MKTNKGFANIILALGVLALVGIAGYFLFIYQSCIGPFSSPQFMVPGGQDNSYISKNDGLYYCNSYFEKFKDSQYQY